MKLKMLPKAYFSYSIDILERVIIILFLTSLTAKIFFSPDSKKDLAGIFFLMSEMTPVLFIFIRRFSQDMSHNPFVWVVGLLGTVTPMMVVPVSAGPLINSNVCIFLTMIGFCIQISAKFTLRRSFGIVAANRGVKIGGPYRFVRHPMYSGYLLAQVGFLLANPSAWNLGIYIAATTIQIVRIVMEERLLSNDVMYRQLVTAVPFRLVPFVY